MKKTLITLLALAAMVALSRPVKADTVTQGGVVYTFTVLEQDSTSPNVWDVQMTVDFSGALTSGTFDSFALQFTGATGVSWESGQGTFGTFALGVNNPSGCNFNGNANAWCTEGGGISFSNDGSGGTYTFVFDVTMPDGTSLPDTIHLQTMQGQGGLAISCSGIGLTGPNTNLDGCDGGTSQVPEPGSLMLFGTGLLGMAGFVRRKLMS